MSEQAPELHGKRVLVTGGLGFIGSNIALQCVRAGASVTIYDCLDPRSGGNLYNIAEVKDRVEVLINDVRSFEGVAPAVRDADVLFNCAAYTSHPSSMKEPLIDIEVNCKGTVNLLEAARRFNSELRFVHVGTSTQIGRMVYSPVDERHPEFPTDIYSANKSASEKYVLVYGSAYGVPVTVVRLANVYGPRSHIKSAEFGFINYFIGLALQGKDLTVFGDGQQKRTVTYVDDCVDALLLAAVRPEARNQVFFAVSDDQFTVAQLAEAIVRAMRKGGVRHVEWPKEREAIDIGDAVITNQKIKDTLGWKAHVGLDEGLGRTRDFFQSCLKVYLR